MSRAQRRHWLRCEALEQRILLHGGGEGSEISLLAYDLLTERVTANESAFFVYRDADSGFNHGFPSGFFAGPTEGGNALTPQRQEELIAGISVNAACIDDPLSPSGCSADPNRLDRERGNVMHISLPPLNTIAPGVHEFAGVNFEEPERFGVLRGNNQPVGQGFDLSGVQRVLFDARSPTPGGLDVQFGIAEVNGNYEHLTDTFQPFVLDISTLQTAPDLTDVHVLFAVVTDAQHAPGGGVVLVDNIRFDPVPAERVMNRPLSFPLGNESFGVVPAVMHVVDNGDAEFSFDGDWTSQNDAGSYLGDRHVNDGGGNGSEFATWRFENLQPRTYVVQATWAHDAGNATNAPFELQPGDAGSPTVMAAVDQTVELTQNTPNTTKFDGRFWQTVGEVFVGAAGTLTAQVSDNGANGTVVADGVRIVPTIPPDQAIRNLTTVYESALVVFALLDRGTAEDLDNARLIADTLLYALAHDNTAAGAQLPTALDGSRGLRDSYSSGDVAWFNNQGPAPDNAQQGEVRLSGFSSDTRLCGPSGFCLVLDGAFGGNNAFGIMALMGAYFEFGEQKYLDGALEIGNWIFGNLADPNGPAFDPNLNPGDETFGGYFLGYPDQGLPKDRAADLIRGKSIENNGDIYAAFSMLGAAEIERDNMVDAAEWVRRANIAGDFVMALFDPGDPNVNDDGHFYTGTLFDPDGNGPLLPPSGAGLEPGGQPEHRRGTDVINVADVLDSNTFTLLPLASSPRYRSALDGNGNPIDWREPVRYVLDTFDQSIRATTGGLVTNYQGFNIVPQATGSQFRPGLPPGGLPQGIAWEFTAQAVVAMQFVDQLYGGAEFAHPAHFYLGQIRAAQAAAPFGDGKGLVAATLNRENDNGISGNAPLDQCLGTPFQCIAERVGLAATTWAIFADRNVNIFAPQLPLPTQAGELFVVEDWDNKVTLIDQGFNYFGGNSGTVNQPAPDKNLPEDQILAMQITTINQSQDTPSQTGESLEVGFDFNKIQNGEFGGIFTSLFGLTDTKVTLDNTGVEPQDPTAFPGYFLDFDDLFRGFGTFADRDIEAIQFDVRLQDGSAPFQLKVELKDEPAAGNAVDIFTRVNVDDTAWSTVTLPRAAFADSISGQGDPSNFDWRRVSVLSLIVEKQLFTGGGQEIMPPNPDTGGFLIDNLVLVDDDGMYPDLAKVENPDDGSLVHFYQDAYLDYVREASSRYFVDFASTDPRTGGIIQDRSTFADLMTAGGAGFQLTSYVIDAERNYLDRADAAQRVLNILNVLDQNQGSGAVGNTGHEGFFYHFLGIDGRRKQNFDFSKTEDVNESLNTVELSTIDTALAIAGVVTAAQYFDGASPQEAQIRQLADQIYGRVNWPFMLADVPDLEDPNVSRQQFYLGWKPNENRDDDTGQFGRFKIADAAGLGQYSSKIVEGQERAATLDFYTDEALLVALLAMGSPNESHRLDKQVWDDIQRQGMPFTKTFPGSLFTYQFGSVWLDTLRLGRDKHPLPVNFFDNTQSAIFATRDFAMQNPNDAATWRNGGGSNRWGLSAAEGPYDLYFAEGAPNAALGMGGRSGAVLIQAEGPDAAGDGQEMLRGNALGGKTILLQDMQSRTFSFENFLDGLYFVSLRYSNDNDNNLPGETVHVSIDGGQPVQFTARDTGDNGAGWNIFDSSGDILSAQLSPGVHTITVSVTGGDGFGIEIDVVTVGYERPLAVGTATVYGAASSILQAPGETLDALWESQRLGLLHPRIGMADAFNLDVADAQTGFTDPADPKILRRSGPWVQFNGFAIDHGPMLVMIDNYLADNFVPRLFMAHPQIQRALADLFAPSQNPRIQFDVDGDGVVQNLDAFILISDLRNNGRRVLPLPPASPPPLFIDVSGNNAADPIDVFIVIAFLRGQITLNGPGSGEGEGRPLAAGLSAPTSQAEGEFPAKLFSLLVPDTQAPFSHSATRESVASGQHDVLASDRTQRTTSASGHQPLPAAFEAPSPRRAVKLPSSRQTLSAGPEIWSEALETLVSQLAADVAMGWLRSPDDARS